MNSDKAQRKEPELT